MYLNISFSVFFNYSIPTILTQLKEKQKKMKPQNQLIKKI
ncbi:hypothetical protein QN326_05130 [Candidatus Phytoplasma asteris]|uniref:Uncharacterized protein n=1 Tax=Candidatus Phytoplasma asteris TaxID=85620 RepID=A0ABZ3CEL8_9MOLU